MSDSPTRLCDLCWPDVEQYLKRSKTILIPIGASEQHGRGCPIGTDSAIASYMAAQLSKRSGAIVTPTIAFGESLSHRTFPGTISIRPTTLIAFIVDLVDSLYINGFRNFLFVNGHGDNRPVVLCAMAEFCRDHTGVRYNIGDFWEFPSVRKIMLENFGSEVGGHADACDASIMLEIAPHLLKRDKFSKEYTSSRYFASPDLTKLEFTSDGTINSDVTLASREIGKELVRSAVSGYQSMLKEFDLV